MAITEKEIAHIAQLARINITPEEGSKISQELDNILNYIEQLSKADTSEIKPLYQTTGVVNTTRLDQLTQNFTGNKDGLIEQAPDKKGRFIKVKSVLKR